MTRVWKDTSISSSKSGSFWVCPMCIWNGVIESYRWVGSDDQNNTRQTTAFPELATWSIAGMERHLLISSLNIAFHVSNESNHITNYTSDKDRTPHILLVYTLITHRADTDQLNILFVLWNKSWNKLEINSSCIECINASVTARVQMFQVCEIARLCRDKLLANFSFIKIHLQISFC